MHTGTAEGVLQVTRVQMVQQYSWATPVPLNTKLRNDFRSGGVSFKCGLSYVVAIPSILGAKFSVHFSVYVGAHSRGHIGRRSTQEFYFYFFSTLCLKIKYDERLYTHTQTPSIYVFEPTACSFLFSLRPILPAERADSGALPSNRSRLPDDGQDCFLRQPAPRVAER